jgi:pimeloyl-ACP methyl ester carboxylesterase
VLTALTIGLAFLAILVAISLVVEAARKRPPAPTVLSWAPEIPIRYVDINGVKARYIRTGTGPTLVLLHTLRTQLDIFQQVIPELAREFTVFAVDYPGHGWSDIPETDYTPQFFARFTADFLETLRIEDALVAGVSIGASIPLLLAAEQNPRIRGIVSINPYDYGQRGIDRANLVAKILFTLAPIPVVGDTVMRLRNPLVEGKILEGGVTSPSALPQAFRDEVFAVGQRPGHYRAFLNLIRHMPLWRKAHEVYHRIEVPVLLVYGDHDWSREAERQQTLREIPGARLAMVEKGGHFLTLDRPDAVIKQISEFAREPWTQTRPKAARPRDPSWAQDDR